MCSVIRRGILAVLITFALSATMPSAVRSNEVEAQAAHGHNDIDQFMKLVLDNRYTSWRRLGDFTVRHVLTVELEAPLEVPFSGFRREYEWYVRNGVAVRSPMRVDGLDIDEDERRDAENDWRRQDDRRRAHGSPENLAPRFISDTYYGTEFPFEPGAYYVADRDTIAGREVVRVEHYPSGSGDEASNPRLSRGFNKTSLITYWIDPAVHEIAKYSFDNAGMDFLPLRWLARVEGFAVSAEMTPAGDVWVPARTTLTGRVTTALGEFQATITQEFFDYREAETGARLIDRWSPR